MTEIIRYVFHAPVISVYEEKVVKSVAVGTDQRTGATIWDKEEIGTGRWFIRISESSAWCVGGEKPNINPGDTIKITMEKVT
jgi:hypothetical protein